MKWFIETAANILYGSYTGKNPKKIEDEISLLFKKIELRVKLLKGDAEEISFDTLVYALLYLSKACLNTSTESIEELKENFLACLIMPLKKEKELNNNEIGSKKNPELKKLRYERDNCQTLVEGYMAIEEEAYKRSIEDYKEKIEELDKIIKSSYEVNKRIVMAAVLALRDKQFSESNKIKDKKNHKLLCEAKEKHAFCCKKIYMIENSKINYRINELNDLEKKVSSKIGGLKHIDTQKIEEIIDLCNDQDKKIEIAKLFATKAAKTDYSAYQKIYKKLRQVTPTTKVDLTNQNNKRERDDSSEEGSKQAKSPKVYRDSLEILREIVVRAENKTLPTKFSKDVTLESESLIIRHVI